MVRALFEMERAVRGHKVGGEVDAYCTKCRMMLGHTIVAMVGDRIARVRCNTCMGDHAFKANPPGTKAEKARGEGTVRPRAQAAPRAKVETLPFEALFEGRNAGEARRYSPKERYAEGDVLEHPTFGLGLVTAVRQDKIDATFRQGPKTLIHGLAGPVSFEKAPRAGSVPPPPADKPPPGEPHGLHTVHAEPPTELPGRED